MALIAASLASSVFIPDVVTPIASAMSRNLSPHSEALNASTCGSKIALQTPWGKL